MSGHPSAPAEAGSVRAATLPPAAVATVSAMLRQPSRHAPVVWPPDFLVALQQSSGNRALGRLFRDNDAEAGRWTAATSRIERPVLARDSNTGTGGAPSQQKQEEGAPGPAEGAEGAGPGKGVEIDFRDLEVFPRKSWSKSWTAPMQTVIFFRKTVIVPIINFPVDISIGGEPRFVSSVEAGIGPGMLRENKAVVSGESVSGRGQLYIPGDFLAEADASTALVVTAEPAGKSDEYVAELRGSGGLSAIARAKAEKETKVEGRFRLEGTRLYLDADARLIADFELSYDLGAFVSVSIIVEEKKKEKPKEPTPGRPPGLPPGAPAPAGGPSPSAGAQTLPRTRPPRPPGAPPLKLPEWLERVLPPEELKPGAVRHVWKKRWPLRVKKKEWHVEIGLGVKAAGGPAALSFKPKDPDLPDASTLREWMDSGEAPETLERSDQARSSEAPPAQEPRLRAAAKEASDAEFAAEDGVYKQEQALQEARNQVERERPPWAPWPFTPGDTPHGAHAEELLAKREQDLGELQERAEGLADRYMGALEIATSGDPGLAGLALTEFRAISVDASRIEADLDVLTVGPDLAAEGSDDPQYTKYAEKDGRLRSPYKDNPRAYFYPDFDSHIREWMEDKVQDMTEDQIERGTPPRRPTEPGEWWFCDEIQRWCDRDINHQMPTLDHRPPVWMHWNRGGNATDQSRRKEWYNGDGNPEAKLFVIPKSMNSSDGAKASGRMHKFVRPTFRGP